MKYVLLILFLCLVQTASASPCSILLFDERPCEIQVGELAPYTGTLMTKSTARSLTDKVFELKTLQVDYDELKLTSQVMYDTYEKRILQLQIELEDAPRPLLEQPLFWIVSGAALVGGFYLGWTLGN